MLPLPVRMSHSKKLFPGGWKSPSNNDTIVNIMTTGKFNEYTFNNDKAKQQLLSSALRKRLEVTKKNKKTTRISMCTGTYKDVIFSLLDEWSNQDLTGGGVQIKSSPGMISVDLCFKGKKLTASLPYKPDWSTIYLQ